VIPARGEMFLPYTVNSLMECEYAGIPVSLILVLNSSDKDDCSVKKINEWVCKRIEEMAFPSYLNVEILNFEDVPDEVCGVGWARKQGMEHAIKIMGKNPGGVIISLDADCLVEKNYIQEIVDFFRYNPSYAGCSIHFEHPIEENGIKPFEVCMGGMPVKAIIDGIIKYEAYLRYWKWGIKWCGYPHYHYTIGSAFAVRAKTYMEVGGMNTRKGGEDFYFLQKVFFTGKKYGYLSGTRVVPSPRPTSYTPFGTANAISRIIQDGTFYVFPFQGFVDIKLLMEMVPHLYSKDIGYIRNCLLRLPSPLTQFLLSVKGDEAIHRVCCFSADEDNFVGHFVRWFNRLRILQYMRFVSGIYGMETIEIAVSKLVKALWDIDLKDIKELLLFLRGKDIEEGWKSGLKVE